MEKGKILEDLMQILILLKYWTSLGVEQAMTLEEKICIKNIECKVLNGRKVSFKVMLEVKAQVFLNENEEMIREVKGIEDIQVQEVSLNMNSLVGQNITKASAKETIVIDNTDRLEEVLGLDINITNKDTKISYNKVLSKADVQVKMIYLTEERKSKKCRRNSSNYGIYRFSPEFLMMIFVM